MSQEDQVAAPPGRTAGNPVATQVAKQVAGIALAAVFLWLSFRNVNLRELWKYVEHLNLWFLLLVVFSGLASHLLRAARWIILLRPLSSRRVGLFNSFAAVMIGYAVNVAIPRGGEVARLVSISRSENLPWAGVLPTMFIDRLLDIALLVALLGLTLTQMPPSATASMPWLVPGGIGLCLATVVGLIVLPFAGRIIKWLTRLPAIENLITKKWMNTASELAAQFDLGTKSLTDPLGFPSIAILSFAIWLFYWLNLYLMVWAFDLQNKIDVAKSLIVFTIGSVGVLVPTPGSVGSYHFLVSQGLQMVAHLDNVQSLAFATVLHAFCFVIVTCVPAALCLAIQSARANRKTGA